MKEKQGVITFKVDAELLEIMKDIPNRSAFIRQAVVNALGVICPICNGSGMLTPSQMPPLENIYCCPLHPALR